MVYKKYIRVAVIDIGTLKTKFEVAEFNEKYSSKLLYKEKKLTVIGRDLEKNGGVILRKSLERSIEVLARYKKIMCDLSVDHYKVVATEALRKAKNSESVIREIYERTKLKLEILDHDEEAEIYFRSVSKDFIDETIAVTDIGGGSVQVVIGRNSDIYEKYLFKTGTYFMQEKFSKTHHPTNEDLMNAKVYLKRTMLPLTKSQHHPAKVIYGSSNIIDFFLAMNIDMVENNCEGEHRLVTDVCNLYPLYEKIIAKCYEDRMLMYPAEPYYMWSADNALLNVFQISEYLKSSKIVPSNNNISSAILNDLAESVT